MIRFLFVLALVGVFLGVARDTAAQDASTLSEAERATLGRLFTEARDAYDAQDYPTSIARLEEAYGIFPEPGILYRIAEMHESIGNNEAAATFYSRYLAAKPDASDKDVIVARIERLREPLARPTELQRARITIVTSPGGATVTVGEQSMGITPVEIELNPGTYRLRLDREGYRSIVKDVDLKASELRSVEYDLVAIQEVAPPEVEDPFPALAIGFGALGLASIGASAAFFVLSLDRAAQLEEWTDSRTSVQRPPQYDEVLDQELTFRVLGWSFAGLAVASTGAAVTLWMMSSEEGTAEVRLIPAPNGAAITGFW